MRKVATLVFALVSAQQAVGDPGYYLLTPYSAPGVLTLDARYWTVKSPGYEAVLWPELGLRYGFGPHWTSELFASFVGTSLREQKLSSLNWQNSYVLTEGQYPFDIAIHAQLIRIYGKGNALELGPVFQTEVGLTQLNFNLIFEHDWTRNDGTELKYQWQALHRLGTGVRMGLQGFGELGRWNHWSNNQSHRAGPVGRLRVLGRVEVQAAYLWGRTYGGRGDMFSAQLTWAF
jgi:hypothetical protein